MSGSSILRFCTVVSNRCVYSSCGGGVYGTGTALLYSNTIARNAGDGAALNNVPTAKFCVFEYNAGSGVYGYGATLTNCLMRFNTASQGGGVNCINAIKIYDCTIVSNTATSQGGGLYLSSYYDACDIRRCVISGNQHATYPGVYDRGWYNTDNPRPSTSFQDCRITDNIGLNSFYLQEGGHPVRFRNCTIAASGACGVNIHDTTYFSPQFTNTIIYGHTTNIYSVSPAVLAVILTNSFRYSCSPQLTAPGFNNVTADPIFVSRPAGNYRLRSTSPCAGAGTTNVLSLYKIDLERVLWGTTVNIGCYKTLVFPKGSSVTIR
jgi:parallel beta-helix repeat protein